MQVKLNDKNEYLVAEIVHRNGQYRLSVHKEYQRDYGDGVIMREFTPFADGNFTAKLFEGRKSSKKLAHFENLLNSNSSLITKMWLGGNYQELRNYIAYLIA